MAKVSVIVTTYNRPKLLSETIKSIINQTFSDFELIVVDNNSNYDFFQLIESFNDSRIRAFQNENNGIIAVNRNVGISHAESEYLAFCDDDDIWLPEKLSIQLNYINKNNLTNSKVVLYSNCIEFSEKQKSIVTNKKQIKNLDSLIKYNEITFSSSLVSNNFDGLKFIETLEFFAVEDFVFWAELKIMKFSFHLNKEILIKYRVTNSSSSAINYGFNHIRRVFALMYIIIKNKEAKINYLFLSYYTIKEMVKFGVKKIIK